MTRAEQKEKRRQEILEAGLDLFIRKGFANTKISDIAEQVGMSAGLLFHYFESKEKLYEELIQIGVSAPRDIMSIQETEPIAFFESAAEKILDSVKNEPFTAKMFVLMSRAVANEALPREIQELVNQMDVAVSCIPLIEAGQKSKTIREGDPYALALAYWAAIQGIAELLAIRPDSPCPKAEWVVDILRYR